MSKIKDKLSAKHELWYRGELKWKLRKHQKKMYDLIKAANPTDYFVLLCSRRLGKTFTMLIIAMEECLQHDNHYVNYASTTIKEIKRAIYPAIQDILKDCPADLKPHFNSQDSTFVFKNGSKLIISGANMGHVDDLRGGTSHLNVIDEAGQVDNLRYLMGSVMNPLTVTTFGRTLIASTPAPSSGHDFFTISETARLRKSFCNFTIDDCDHLAPEVIEKIEKECMETDCVDTIEESDTYNREYRCKWITDSTRKVIKSWKDPFRLIEPTPKDEYYKFHHKYTSMDMAFKRDMNAILFGHYVHKSGILYIESEHVDKGMNTVTSKLAPIIKSREALLWGTQAPYQRWCDNNEPRFVADLNTDYGIKFIEVGKQTKISMVNQVIVWVQQGRISVDPSCLQLIGCLDNAIWNNSFDSFDRTEAYGHYDALDALIYLVLNVDIFADPIPLYYGKNYHGYRMPEGGMNHQVDRKTAEALKLMFPMALGKKDK